LKVALITGASSGIGRETALAFSRENIHVVAIARRVDRLTELQNEIDNLPKPHGDILSLEGDVSDGERMAQLCQQAYDHFGRLDYLVANAGVGHRGAIVDAEWEHLQTLLRTNIDGVLHTIRVGVPYLKKTGGGHIITISSVTFNLVSPYAATYAASKAFVSSMANSLRIELAPDNIKVTDFLVGRTHTEFNEKRLGGGKRSGSGIPTMPPDKVANAIVKATQQNKKTVILRPFDRLLVFANRLVPNLIGKLAERQYK